jgi:FkbM family methyltransferase
MLNLEIGDAVDVAGHACIQTEAGKSGHAIYGPYKHLEPGNYIVAFRLAGTASGKRGIFGREPRCAVLDVVSNVGSEQLARQEIRGADVDEALRTFTLRFTVSKPGRIEYRVWVSGEIPMVIDTHPRVARIDGGNEADAIRRVAEFPDEAGATVPFFVDNRDMLKSLFDQNIDVRVVDDTVILTVNGISIYTRSRDDLNFIGEIFHENAYNFKLGRDACVIDIGMNIGLATLMFAGKPEVREVHSFEPFTDTYQRASANIALNPALAAKVQAFNHGLSDRDWDGPIDISRASDSGAMSTVAVAGGTPTHISLRDASAMLRPIIDDAHARGLAVIVKVDCEGSEFAIFKSLAQTGMLALIDAVMVEWHAMFEAMTQEDLIAPLRQAGFIIFDRSPPTGNGFFYAARLAS